MPAVIVIIGLLLWRFADAAAAPPERSDDMELVARVLLVLIGAAPLLVVVWFL